MFSPEVDEVLFAYLAISSYAISFVLIRVDSGIQRPIYFVSKSLHKAEVHYLPLEETSLLFPSTHCGCLTQLLLKSILRSADYIERIAKWGIILGAFDIKYMPCTSIKGQVLADLVADFAKLLEEAKVKQPSMDEKSVGLISTQDSSSWKVYVDGAINQRGAGVGLVLVYLEKITIEKSLRLGFSATNNEAEYEALLMGMVMV